MKNIRRSLSLFLSLAMLLGLLPVTTVVAETVESSSLGAVEVQQSISDGIINIAIENSGFEDGLIGWENINGKLNPRGTFSQSNEIKYSGNASLKISGEQVGVFNSGSFGISEGYVYRARAMMYTTGSMPRLELKFYDMYTSECGSADVIMNGVTNQWTEVMIESTAPVGAVMARLVLYGSNADVFADDVSIVQLPLLDPNSWTEHNGKITSDYIEVTPGSKYCLRGDCSKVNKAALWFYDCNDTVINVVEEACNGSVSVVAFAPKKSTKVRAEIIGASVSDSECFTLDLIQLGTQLPDGSFESMAVTDTTDWSEASVIEVNGTNGWVADYTAQIAVTNEKAYSGTKSLKITTTVNGGATTPYYTATVGESYTVSAWYQAGSPMSVYLEFFDGLPKADRSNRTGEFFTLCPKSADWKEILFTAEAPVNSTHVTASFYFNASTVNGWAYVDDVEIYQTVMPVQDFEEETLTKEDEAKDNPLEGWVTDYTATMSLATDKANSGGNSLKINTMVNGGATTPAFEVTEGKTYKINAWYQSGSPVFAYFEFFNGTPQEDRSNRVGEFYTKCEGTSEWTEIDYSAVAPADSEYVLVSFYFNASTVNGWAYVDDVVIFDDDAIIYEEDFEPKISTTFVVGGEWGPYLNATVEKVNEVAYSGTNCLKAVSTETQSRGRGVVSPYINASPKTTYYVEAYIMSDKRGELYLQFYDDVPTGDGITHVIAENCSKFEPTDSWTKVSHSSIAPKNTKYVSACFYYRGDAGVGGVIYLDDVVLSDSQSSTKFDFESSWIGCNQDSKVSTSTEISASGSCSIKVEGTHGCGIVSPILNVVPGECLIFKSDYLSDKNINVTLDFYDRAPILPNQSDKIPSNDVTTVFSSTVWNSFRHSQIVPDGANYVTARVELSENVDNGVLYLDNATIIKSIMPIEDFEYDDNIVTFKSMVTDDTTVVTDGNVALVLTNSSLTSGTIPALSGKNYSAVVDVTGDAILTMSFYDHKGVSIAQYETATEGYGCQTLRLDKQSPQMTFGVRITLTAVNTAYFDNVRIYTVTESVSNASFEDVSHMIPGKHAVHWQSFGDVVSKSISSLELPHGPLAMKLIGIGDEGGICSSMISANEGVAYVARAYIDGNAQIRIRFYDAEFNDLGTGIIAPASTKYACVEIVVGKGQTAIVDDVEFSTEIIDVNNHAQLFIDDFIIDNTTLERKFHQGEKSEPLFSRTDNVPWESGGSYLYGSVIYDEDEEIYKMWYQTFDKNAVNGGDVDSVMAAYAISEDGVNWERPILNIYERNGTTENNLIGNYHCLSVFKDKDEEDPDKLYKMITFHHSSKYLMYYSADGIHWNGSDVVYPSGDVITAAYDEFNDKYLCTMKHGVFRRDQWTIVGTPEEGWSTPIMANTLANVMDARKGYHAHSYGQGLYERDGTYIGFDWLFKLPSATNAMEGTFEIQLTYSRDISEEWQRPTYEPILPQGKNGDIDDGIIVTAAYPIEVGDEVWLYCGGFDEDHGIASRNSCIYIAKWRLDGFASMNGIGSLVTKPVTFSGNALRINSKGNVTVELLDENGISLTGVSDPIVSDSVNSLVTWSGVSDLSFINQPVIIKFTSYEDSTELYSFAFGDGPESATITIKSGVEDGSESIVVNKGDIFTLPENHFVNEGYKFIGWTVGDEIMQVGDRVIVDESITIVANWEKLLSYVEIVGSSLILDGRIGVKMYFEIDKDTVNLDSVVFNAIKVNGDYMGVSDMEELYKEYLNASMKESSSESLSRILYDEGKELYYVIFYVPAKDADNITFEAKIKYSLINSSEIIECKIKPNVNVLSYVSIAKANAEAGEEQFVEALEVINALENYLKYADAFFNNKSIEPYSTTAKIEVDEPLRSGTIIDGIEFYGTSLVLEDAVTIRHYFVIKDEDAFKKFGCVTNVEYGTKGNYIYFDISDIPAHELGDQKALTFTHSDEVIYTIQYSVINYITSVISNSDTNLSSLANSMYDYYLAAMNYAKQSSII